MYYFKYFRNDTNLDKSIRYNELFFASNSSLNDPLDLSFNPMFWDDSELWKQFIGSYDNGLVALMNYICPPKNDDFYLSLNDLFSGRNLIQVVEQKKYFYNEIFNLIKKHGLATGIDIDSAAKILMDKFVQIKNNTNFLSVSFSKDPFNYLMWSHYANGFKGCTLIYDFKKNETKLKTHILGNEYLSVDMQDIQYSSIPKQLSLWKLISQNIIDDEGYFFTKNQHWVYEKESRLVLYSPQASDGEILHHEPSLVKGVIFGSRCDTSFKNRIIRGLRESRIYSGDEYFFSFNSSLNEKNEIELHSGYKHIVKNIVNISLKRHEIVEWNNIFRYESKE